MRATLLSATLFAGFASAPAFAAVPITTAYGGDVAYTTSAISPNGTSQASGVTSVVLPQFISTPQPTPGTTVSNGYTVGYSASVPGNPDYAGSFSAYYANSGGELNAMAPTGAKVSASGLVVITKPEYNYPDVVSSSLTLPQAQSYFGGIVDIMPDINNPTLVSFYSGSALMASISYSWPNAGTAVHNTTDGNTWYASYLNVDFLYGVTYNKVVLSDSASCSFCMAAATLSAIETGSFPVSYVLQTNLAPNSTVASLNSTTTYTPAGAPLPVLGGSPLAALAILGVVGRGLLRRKRTA
jgi:hypothetical protein